VEKEIMAYPWPGNVRELKNVIERAVYKSDGGMINHVEFDPFHNPYFVGENSKQCPQNEENSKKYPDKSSNEDINSASLDLAHYQQKRKEFDLLYLKQALAEAKGNQKEAAQLMHLSYDQLRGLYRKFKKDITE
jgi:psp operon transcriptional activator